MNSEMPSHEETAEITSLVAASTHALSIRASLVTRGLRDIAEFLRADAIKSVQDQALDLYMQTKFAEAIDFCNAQLEIDPKDDALLQIKGVCLAKLGNVEEGLDCYGQAIAVNSENPHCWLLKSRLLKMLDLTDKRLQCLRRVIQIEPSYEGVWREIGVCLLELRRYDEAIEAFDSGLRQNPSDGDCLSQKDIALAELARDQRLTEVSFMVVYDRNKGWHVVKEEDVKWKLVGTDSNGRETWQAQETCFGPFSSNNDPNEGPVGSGEALAEALAEEKRRLYPNGPVQGEPRSG